MDKNSTIGLLIIFLLLIGYFYLNKPDAAEIQRQKQIGDSIALVEKTKKLQREEFLKAQKIKEDSAVVSTAAPDTFKMNARYGGFGSSAFGTEDSSILENDHLKIILSNKGGVIRSVQLKKFKRFDSTELILFDKDESGQYMEFLTKDNPVKTDMFYWQVAHADKNRVVYRLHESADKFIEQTYTLSAKEFNVQYDIRISNLNTVIQQGTPFTLNWHVDLPPQEMSAEMELPKSSLYYKFPEEDADYIGETDFEDLTTINKINWVSFKQQFFNSTLISAEGFLKDSKLEVSESKIKGNIKKMSAALELPFDNEADKTIKLTYFFGPNKFKTLSEQEAGLEKMVPLGWGIFGFINKFMIIPIFNWLSSFMSNFGIIILMLTLIIKTLLLPLVYKSYQSTAKMKILKPEIDAIKEKHGKDMQAAQMENMKLYKKAGVNPLGGCLPLLLQMPILIGIFQFFPAAFEFRQQSFLWAVDLSRYDSIWEFGYVPVLNAVYGSHVSLFTLLMTISTLIYTRLNNQITGVNEQMKWISYLMPIMFLGFFNKYPAALTYYYFLSNVITFAQQWFIRRFTNEDKLRLKIAANKNKKGSDKKSGFQQRLEAMAKSRGVDLNKTGKRK